MTTASLPLTPRRLSWRMVLAAVAAVVAIIAFVSLTVGFASSESNPSTVTNTSIDSDLLRCRPNQPC